jgi:hypothetical protein
MRRAITLLSLSALILGFVIPARSQHIIRNLGPAPIIAGQSLVCNGAVSYVAQIPDIAMARPGALFFRPDYFSLPQYIQWFIYAHECAHQVVGSDEQAADCWAVKLGRNQGFFPPQAMQQICAFTFPSPGDWTHLPGPLRCRQMDICYRAP